MLDTRRDTSSANLFEENCKNFCIFLVGKKAQNRLPKLKCICSFPQCFHDANPFSFSFSSGCDDLLPILSYVLIKSAMPQIVSECSAMEEFIHEG